MAPCLTRSTEAIASNRDTSDAPLLSMESFCQEARRDHRRTAALSNSLLTNPWSDHQRESCARSRIGYARGTPKWHSHGPGLRIDLEARPRFYVDGHQLSRLHPAPRLPGRNPGPLDSFVAATSPPAHGVAPGSEPWSAIADRAEKSLREYFWLEDEGYLADLLIAKPGQSAANAVCDNALRPNFLFAIAFGFLDGIRAQRAVSAAWTHLLVPGALRTLAPLPIRPPLPIRGNDDRLLNDPDHPDWGPYQGDEDTRRKPAYHNGTAWLWVFPAGCESAYRKPGIAQNLRRYSGGKKASR